LIRWIPDTCFCVFIVENDLSVLLKVEQKCELHKDLDDSIILNIVHKFNQAYDIALGDNPTKEEILTNQALKDKEKLTTRRKDV